MLQPRIWASARAYLPSTSLPPTFLLPSLLATTSRPTTSPSLILSPEPFSKSQQRHASHASQGRANKAAQGPGKRLGAKKGDSELVVPGNIIFKQRGTHWFAGDNCGMGRDHTIYALAKGFVRYYSDPARAKDKKFIGVVLERGMTLPRPRNSPRTRRCGFEARVIENAEALMEKEGELVGEMVNQEGLEVEMVQGKTSVGLDKRGDSHLELNVPVVKGNAAPPSSLPLRDGYMYRQANWEIGRAAERAKVKVRPYKPNDRFLAWRKTERRKTLNIERRSLRKRK
ncbi:54S ribosomal protein L2 mitochondrial [Agyrium rufum]|nr:54S ribosomal protein L2 mitochondrial [Agyrium rufum]